MNKPVIGNLVVIDLEKLPMDERLYMNETRLYKPGVIIKCFGVRCSVFWPDGSTTSPERSVLKVLA